MKMGDRIRELRILNSLTQEELAERLGLQKSAIAKYENGRVENIKRSVIKQMADIFKVTPSYVMGLEQEPKHYYLNDETREIAQEIFENKDMRILFDVARKTEPNHLKAYAEFLRNLQKEERDN